MLSGTAAVAALAGVQVLGAGGEFYTHVRVMAGDTTHFTTLNKTLAFLHPLYMRGHDHFILCPLIFRHEYIHYFREFHAGPEVEKGFIIVQHSNTLQVAPLAHIVL